MRLDKTRGRREAGWTEDRRTKTSIDRREADGDEREFEDACEGLNVVTKCIVERKARFRD